MKTETGRDQLCCEHAGIGKGPQPSSPLGLARHKTLSLHSHASHWCSGGGNPCPPSTHRCPEGKLQPKAASFPHFQGKLQI